MPFEPRKPQPKFGEAQCPRCGRRVYRAPSKKCPEKTIVVDERAGPYEIEEQDDGSIFAVWAGPYGRFAYHYNGDYACATDAEAEEANDI